VRLCQQHGVEIVKGHAMPDHIHLCLSIPPKYSVAHYDRVSEREVGDSYPPTVPRSEAELHWTAFLGARLLRKHRRLGRGENPCLPSEPGRRGEAARTAAA
jgi:hypothetical protein